MTWREFKESAFYKMGRQRKINFSFYFILDQYLLILLVNINNFYLLKRVFNKSNSNVQIASCVLCSTLYDLYFTVSLVSEALLNWSFNLSVSSIIPSLYQLSIYNSYLLLSLSSIQKTCNITSHAFNKTMECDITIILLFLLLLIIYS